MTAKPDLTLICQFCGYRREYPVVRDSEIPAVVQLARGTKCATCESENWIDYSASKLK